MTREERVQQLMQVHGLSRDEAELAYEIEAGESDGDVEEVDEGES